MGVLRKQLSAMVTPKVKTITDGGSAESEENGNLTGLLFEAGNDSATKPSIVRLPSALPPPPSEGDLVDWFHGKPSTPAGYAARSGLLDHCSPVDLFEIEGELLAEPPRVYRRAKHSKDEPYDKESTYSRLSGRTA